MKRTLARKLILYVVLVSSAITLLTSAWQLYGIFKRDVHQLEEVFDEISKVHLASLAVKLWVSDKQEAGRHAEGILSIQGVKYVQISEDNKTWLKKGMHQTKHFMFREYPLTYLHRNKVRTIGNLYIEISTESAYQEVYTQIWSILISNAIKTFLVAGFILFIFNHLVTRHLEKISRYLLGLELEDKHPGLVLDRKTHAEHNLDELDVLVDSVEQMKARSRESIKQIRKTDALLNLLMESVEEGVYGIDRSGLCTFVNKSALHLLGYEDEQELIGQPMHELIQHSHASGSEYPHEESLVRRAMLADEGVHADDQVLWRKDGSPFPIEYWSHPVKEDGYVIGAVVTFINISARKANEALIKETMNELNYYKYALDQHAMITVTDLDGRIVYANDMFCKISGYGMDELVGYTHKRINSGHHDDKFFMELWQSISNGRIWKGDIRNKTRQGDIFWSETTIIPHIGQSGKPDRYIALRSDITEKKIIEEERTAQAERWKILSTLGIGMSGDPDRIFMQICHTIGGLFFVPAIYLYRVTKSGVVQLCEHMHENTSIGSEMREQIQYLADEVRVSEGQVTKACADAVSPYCMQALPVKDHKSEIVAVLCLMATEENCLSEMELELIKPFIQRIASELELKQSAEDQLLLEHQLQQAQKMEALGLLAGGIAHDFNNMLAAILGYSYLAEETIKNNPGLNQGGLSEYLDQIHAAGERARDLIQQMMVYSRSDNSEVGLLNPGHVVKEVVKLLRSTLPVSIHIHINAAKSTAMIEASAVAIYQIVMNLCINARDAIGEKGEIEITVKPESVARHQCSACGEHYSGEYVLLQISDTGPGFADAISEKLFEPFFTTKSAGKGTGMGLSMVKDLVHRFNGHIEAESGDSNGAIFSLYLPAKEADADNDSVHTVSSSSLTTIENVNYRVMVVDDELSVARMHGQLLESNGFTVSVVNSGVDAMQAFLADPDRFDLVITDQTMPGMTGADLARGILEIRPDFPIVLCTGYSEHLSEKEAKEIGIREYLMKPVKTADLLQAINQNLNQE